MAEQVQAILDGMVAPLRDLEERKVFSSDEIRSIVNRRRTSEYALQRRKARQADYIEYIQQEIQLEKLRALRVKRIKRQQPHDETTQQGATTRFIGDKHIGSHIHFIWTRTIRKFRSDMAVYLMYAEYLEETKNYNKLSLLYAQALQLFPRETGLWINAASHEYFVAGNMQSARVLLQRGLRINPTSQELWVQSFVLEMHVVQKMQGREAILRGGGDVVANGSIDILIDENHPLALSKLVYDHAIQKITDKVSFRLAFLQQCSLFPNTQALAQHILQSIIKDCGNQPDAWIVKAMYILQQEQVKHVVEPVDDAGPVSKKQRMDDANGSSLSPSRTIDAVRQVLLEATQQLATTEMYTRILQYLKELVEEGKEESDGVIQLAKQFVNQASDDGMLSNDLIMAYAALVVEGDDEHVGQLIERFQQTSEKITASLWLQLAQSAASVEQAIVILERGLEATPMVQSDHLILLLQLLGAKLKLHSISMGDLLRTQERILYLAPGFVNVGDNDDAPFGIINVMDACLQCLMHVWKHDGLGAARKAYLNVLFQANTAKLYMRDGSDHVKEYLDAAISIETNCQDVIDRQRRLARIFSYALELFAGTEIGKEYRKLSLEAKQDRDVAVNGVKEVLSGAPIVPSMDVSSSDFSPIAFATTFDLFKLVHLRNLSHKSKSRNAISWQNLALIYDTINADDQATWCVETKEDDSMEVSPATFLSGNGDAVRAYCSFLVQNDKTVLEDTLARLPVQEIDCLQDCTYEDALWFFFGRNPRVKGALNLSGRSEHTDSVSHDGTWHYQLSGSKIWELRASSCMKRHLDQHFACGWDESKRLVVKVEQGDVLVINTRLWFHQTIIPPQRVPSVSYARDFCFDNNASDKMNSTHMTNVDGMYATSDIEEGTILFREADMPSCELHRATNDADANCDVVELEDGTSAVVSTRKIAAGEFFSVPESDDESGDGDESDTVEDDESAADEDSN
ncbi:hypothetical protein MPSEU_000983900 [Mayamaea pseudoterrestris]|nr:hypothetical protein MPSEU_000983900 [Mayamaea pseudoterrestris]